MFKVDMANTFKTLRLNVFLTTAKKRAQALYRLLRKAYSGPTNIFYGNTN